MFFYWYFNLSQILLFLVVNNNLVYARSCHSRPSNVGNEVCYDAGEPPSFVKNKACELCNTDGCNGVKNTTNDTPSNLSTNGPSNVPTNAPSTTSTNAPADNKGASSDATHFSPLALFVVIPVAVARSFLLQWSQLEFWRQNSEPIAANLIISKFKNKFDLLFVQKRNSLALHFV